VRPGLIITLYIMGAALFTHGLVLMITMPALPEGSGMIELYAATGPAFHSFALCLLCLAAAEILLSAKTPAWEKPSLDTDSGAGS